MSWVGVGVRRVFLSFADVFWRYMLDFCRGQQLWRIRKKQVKGDLSLELQDVLVLVRKDVLESLKNGLIIHTVCLKEFL